MTWKTNFYQSLAHSVGGDTYLSWQSGEVDEGEVDVDEAQVGGGGGGVP